MRYDLVQADAASGEAYLAELAAHHVSGQLKVAPEHAAPAVLKLMKKPGIEAFERLRAERNLEHLPPRPGGERARERGGVISVAPSARFVYRPRDHG